MGIAPELRFTNQRHSKRLVPNWMSSSKSGSRQLAHKLEVAKTADWIVDMGPEGGDEAARSSSGPCPSRSRASLRATGQRLKPVLARTGASRGAYLSK
jgi:hypothetical protein